MIAEYNCRRFSGYHIEVTEEEVIIAGLKIPVSSILDVVIFPISGNLRGLGGCIKFVTEDNPELPVMNSQRGWDVIYQGMDGNPKEAEIVAHYAALPLEEQEKDYEPFNSMLKLIKEFNGLRIYQLH